MNITNFTDPLRHYAPSYRDKTFGLKNKNKSKKVAQYVQSTTKSIMNSGDQQARREADKLKNAKAAKRAMQKAKEEERDALFGEALMAVQKKTTTKMKSNTEAIGRDGGEEGKKEKPGQSRAMKMMYQMDAKEMADKMAEDPNYVKTLEDEVEMQRQQKVAELKASGKKGTPVTEETLRVWQENKKKRKRDELQKQLDAEAKKKKGGKGLSILSGRALYDMRRDLFVDDEAGAEEIDTSNMVGLAEGGEGEASEFSGETGLEGQAGGMGLEDEDRKMPPLPPTREEESAK